MFTCMPKTGITSYLLLTKLLIKKSYNLNNWEYFVLSSRKMAFEHSTYWAITFTEFSENEFNRGQIHTVKAIHGPIL